MYLLTTQRRSMMGFIVIAFFAVGASVFLVRKGSEAASEIELLNTGPVAGQRAALMRELNDTNNAGGIDTSNWKTYRNEKYGFEVKYPEDVKINLSEGYKSAEFYVCKRDDCTKFLVLDWGPLDLDKNGPYKNYHRLEASGYLDSIFYFYGIGDGDATIQSILSTFKFTK